MPVEPGLFGTAIAFLGWFSRTVNGRSNVLDIGEADQGEFLSHVGSTLAKCY